MSNISRLAAAHETSVPAEQQTIAELVELEQREKQKMGLSDRVAAVVTAVVGSMYMVWLNLLWFAAWIGLHSAGLLHFDPYPFGLLTMVVSLEAIFFSLFVLIAQNRQAQITDKRAKLDLQVNLIAEREVTKVIEMVSAMHEQMGLERVDPEAEEMQRPTHVRELARKMDRVEAVIDPHSRKGPISASDTRA